MPKIPTFSAQLSGGNINPVEASPQSAAMPYNALARVGETVAQTGQMFGAIIEKRKQQNDIVAADERHSQVRRKLDEFLQTNQNSPTLAEDFKQYGDSLLVESAADLPSQEAQKMFRSKTLNAVDARYGAALEIGERNRLTQAKVEMANSAVDAATSYRVLFGIDPSLADSTVREDLDAQLVQIEKGFGGIAPGNAASLKNSVTLDVITGVMEASPKTALELIDEYPLDEQQRRALKAQAEAKIMTRDALQVQQFNQKVQDALGEAVKNGEIAVQPKLDEYITALKDPKIAEATYNEQRVKFEVHNRALGATSWIRGKSPEHIAAQLEKIRESETGEVGKEVYDASIKFADKLMKERNDDISSYVRKYNPAIQELEGAKISATPQDAIKIEKEINSMVLRYQGPPPPPDALGNKVHDYAYYQNIPSHAQSVLTKGQASNYAKAINEGTPDQKVAAMMQFEAFFDENTKHVAWRDLTTLPKGQAVSQAAQMASLHLGTDVAKKLLSDIQNLDDNVKRKGIELSKYHDELKQGKNANWDAFSAAYAGDASQNAASVAGFRDAIVAYAVGLDVKSPRDAIQLATQTLLDKKFRFEEVNGELVPFAKWNGPDGRDLSDDEMLFSPSVSIIPAGATVGVIPSVKETFNNLDFSNVKTTSADGVNLFPDAPAGVSGETFSSYLNTQLNAAKKLKPSEDGKGFYVYMRNEMSRIDTQLFTKDGKPMFIPYFEADPRRNAPQRILNPRIQRLEGYTNPAFETPKYNMASPLNRQ